MKRHALLLSAFGLIVGCGLSESEYQTRRLQRNRQCIETIRRLEIEVQPEDKAKVAEACREVKALLSAAERLPDSEKPADFVETMKKFTLMAAILCDDWAKDS